MPTQKARNLDRVSTGRGSDLVSRSMRYCWWFLIPLVDQVATASCTDPIQAEGLEWKIAHETLSVREIPH